MDHEAKRLERHDVSDLIGLRVVVVDAAMEITEADGGVSYEVPNIEQLECAAAVARCLVPVRLKGAEIRAIRHIAGWTAAELGERLNENVAAETISRWENDKQGMGGYAEKVLRLVVCEALADRAPGVDYRAGAIAELRLIDAWRSNPDYVLPPLVFECTRVREDHRVMNAWAPELPLAA